MLPVDFRTYDLLSCTRFGVSVIVYDMVGAAKTFDEIDVSGKPKEADNRDC